MLSMENDQLQEVEIRGFSSEQSIYCGNMAGGLLLQVTTTNICLIKSSTLEMVNEVKLYPKRVTGAVSTLNQVVVSISGGELIYLELDVNDGNNPVLQLVGQLQMEHDVACISIRPLSIDSNQHQLVN